MSYIMHRLENYINVKALVSAFEAVRESDFVFSGEMHNFWEMVYAADGKIGITRDDNVFILNKGEIIFHKPMEFHRLWSEGGNSAKIMVFAFDADGEGLKLLENGIFRIELKDEGLLREILKHVEAVFKGKDMFTTEDYEIPESQSRQLIKIYLEQFMISVLNSANAKSSQKKTASSNNYNTIINKMKENVYNSLSVEKLAKMCNLSVSNLKKIFKIYSGEGIMHYFNRMKIYEAINLMKTDLSIGEISDMLSYSGQDYFTVAFKRETGTSPTEYRRNFINSD
ncbi:MAG: AraC family transcriptional regulator [Bacillota bacterium]|nr:AraC family transcriptional regulator [Bacillota bacterium]